MARLRGVDPFSALWSRRTTWDLPEGFQIDSLSLPDLVASKKTQRDKDWPMVRRLVEASYDQGFSSPTPERIEFWLRELRTPELLVDCVRWFREDAHRLANERAAVKAALAREVDVVRGHLATEEAHERALDRAYWEPLKAELEVLRTAEGDPGESSRPSTTSADLGRAVLLEPEPPKNWSAAVGFRFHDTLRADGENAWTLVVRFSDGSRT